MASHRPPDTDPMSPGFRDHGIVDPEAYLVAREGIAHFAGIDQAEMAAVRDPNSLNALLGHGQLGQHFRNLLRAMNLSQIFQSVGEPGSTHIELAVLNGDTEISYHEGTVNDDGTTVNPQVAVSLPITEEIQSPRPSIHAPRAVDYRFVDVRYFPSYEAGGFQSDTGAILVAGNPDTYTGYARCAQLMAQGVLGILPPLATSTENGPAVTEQ